ncbi:MAG: hydrogenase [Chlamydiae bacterium]|nr:hydrogenase [Chlamydiota bacterium]
MPPLIDMLMIVIVIMNLMFLSTSSLKNCIRLVSIQGVLIGVLPLLFVENEFFTRTIFISLITIFLKGIVFPWLLFRALRKAYIKREAEPFVSYRTSLVVGLFALIFSFWITKHLVIPREVISSLVVSVSFFTTFIGLFIIISRVKALTQVLGYLVIENGIYMFSFAFLIEQPFLVEFGVLLDVFVGVFVMGIAIFHINREFNHINTKKLSVLKD